MNKLGTSLLIAICSLIAAHNSLANEPSLEDFANRVLIFHDHFEEDSDPGFGVIEYRAEENCYGWASGSGDGLSPALCLSPDGTPYTRTFAKEERRPYITFTYKAASGTLEREVDASVIDDLIDYVEESEGVDLNSDEELKTVYEYKIKDQALWITGHTYLGSKKIDSYMTEVRPASAFEGVKVKMARPDKFVEQRFYLEDSGVTEDMRRLKDSIVEIASYPTGYSIDDSSSGISGSAFMISPTGLFLTNAHVISSLPGCEVQVHCKVYFYTADGLGNTGDVPIQVLALDHGHDIALFQVLPEKFPHLQTMKPLDIQADQLGPELITAGFPGDRDGFTISKGLLSNFYSDSFWTTTYINHGASGSPVLDAKSKAVVGIATGVVSNSGETAPGIVVPMAVVNERFHLSDYIDGKMQDRIKKLVAEILFSTHAGQVRQALKKIEEQRSLYAVPLLDEVLTTDIDSKSRQLVVETLRRLRAMMGRNHPLEKKAK